MEMITEEILEQQEGRKNRKRILIYTINYPSPHEFYKSYLMTEKIITQSDTQGLYLKGGKEK